ncbi:response regulator [Dissulfurirhabdus thermomarina]|uniref:protein-glutamate methylesterase n=1 Tax=Dissulfurirhabdus thermomarina TaxID=1765737 RepID=A0A6N9TKI5_DISTH|nr:response regulator [Dissulfurirhabdus thermomarina]NDY41781.1 response regulator [Dissulfurirhabdus thermomarina]NMX23977.1 response regulator [Dissulfurirhabdus thermomarina]
MSTAPNWATLDLLLEEEPVQGFSGWLQELSLADVVQLACLEGGERVLIVRHGDQEGEIYFAGGEIVHAAYSGGTGQDAFFDILSWPSGSFWFRPGVAPERSIDAPWNFMLIEALRLADERRRKAAMAGDDHLKVLVVDDSPLVCKAMRKILEEGLNVEVVAEANNGRAALEMIEQHRPDLLTLDVNMPVMGGDVALMHIMIRSPAPVVLVSGLDARGAARVMEFLRLGAVDFVPKPEQASEWQRVAGRLNRSLNYAKQFSVHCVRRARSPKKVTEKARPGMPARRLAVVIGGIGGLLEAQKILPALPALQSTSVLVVQDMIADLVPHMSAYIDKFSALAVSPLQSGAPLLSSQCWLANWDAAWEVVADADGAAIRREEDGGEGLDAGRLLRSAAEAFGASLLVVVLSGTDLDLEDGLQSVVKKGGRILLQDPAGCLMPGPVENLRELELEDGVIEPEKVPETLAEWDRGG